MNEIRGLAWLFSRFRTTAEALAGKLRRNSGAELTGLLRPKSVLAKSEPASTDPAEHAEDFALRYFEPLENFRLML
jgi:hypothetical protein